LMICWEPPGKVVAEQNISKEVVSYSKPVYKLDKTKIFERLSSNDKMEFDKIINRLSAFDIGKMKEYYEGSNDEESVKNIFKLLKKRLTIEDYTRIHEISSSFLEFDNIK
jgi:predicted ribonuclease toxin of YeeF-YezG toxin-antitoxin module